ncbi:MAG TPA: 5-methyltetrahydropteroyltriglutamate--homocysteine S-methyltransferase, partial [Spirochaetia bacterium]|nr:5-methyltetrahydropteroyltriglutamate--homocysteine S-methyltransferase [Spirochaetia bacterium]
LQRAAGIDVVPCGDFSLYDHVLDTAVMLGVVPHRFGAPDASLAGYFTMARGASGGGREISPLEMTKWFDTNYHYLVPELSPGQGFRLNPQKLVAEWSEARALKIPARPVVLGPVTFLSLAKQTEGADGTLSHLDRVLPAYAELLRHLAAQGADWVQIDEPILVMDLEATAREAFRKAYQALGNSSPAKLLLTTYFGDLRDNLDLALKLPVAGLHLDLVRGPTQLDAALRGLPAQMSLSLGVVDGRNIWRTDLEKALGIVEKAAQTLGSDRVWVSSSCSLLHSPEDLTEETGLDPELKSWLAFARQKLAEIAVLARGANHGRSAIQAELEESTRARESRRASPRTSNPAVRQRLAGLGPQMSRRASRYPQRREAQSRVLKLPLFPSTTIGSFPQTHEVRAARAGLRSGKLTLAEYEDFLRKEIERTVRLQESLGLDVLVHGEFERNDMVEYFGEMLAGFAFTRNGWVQSYGSRCVKPPVIYGDVERTQPMTVRWSSYAQSLTDRPMKGMLTGPVTILAWSFVRDDQPREATCRQIALAIRDEVQDLEKAGIKVIQIDEPALREGLPLRHADWSGYLGWAVESFRIASSGVRDETQIHTHMCYSEFNEIVPSIVAMDADVISIESARSRMELLGAFRQFNYPNAIGPGVYDIHSPRVPSTQEVVGLLQKAVEVLAPEQLWVNPDCGLKTRQWSEAEPAVRALTEAARRMREQHAGNGSRPPKAEAAVR